MGQAHLAHGIARRSPARWGRAAVGLPVATLQKAQARVQISPMIMKVACFFSQHSPMLGQPASSQTVTRPCELHDLAGLGIAARRRRLDADPVRLARDLLVGPMGLFRVARPRPVQRIEDRHHGALQVRRADCVRRSDLI